MPAYQLKRTYQVGYQPPTKRSRLAKPKLTRQLALRTPEIKDIVLSRTIAQLDNNAIDSAGIFSAIVQGISGGTRIGDQIRVLSIEVSGRVYGQTALDATFALIRTNDASRPPQLGDFGTTIGGLYDHSHGWVVHESFRDAQTNNVMQKQVFTFPLGMIVKYTTGSEAEESVPNRNEIFAVHVNRTGANNTVISYSIRVRFVDA